MGESHVLRACLDYLEWGRNQGKWYYERMNSGTIFPQNHDGTTRRVNLCRKGTADVLVIKGLRTNIPHYIAFGFSEVLWVETKHKGKQAESQKAFEAEVRAQGCDYMIVTDVDQLKERLEG